MAESDHPLPSRIRTADWLLRIAILLYALGLVRALFTRAGTSMGSIALLEWEVSHAHILMGEKMAAALILLCAVTVIIRPTTIALLIIAGLVFAEACAGVRAGGFHFYELNVYALALRYLSPLALIPLISSARLFPSVAIRCQASAWILRIGLATVFIIHGYEAWMLHPHFIDFIIATAQNLAGLRISETHASQILKVIGIVDFLVAGLVLIRAHPILLGWLCFWGLITALSRPVSLGFASYPEVLLRTSHWIAPLVVGFLTAAAAKSRQPASPAKTGSAEGRG